MRFISLRGRAGRLEYLLFTAGNLAFSGLAGVAAEVGGTSYVWVMLALCVPVFWLSTAATSRRLNDLQMSRWWMLALALPFLNVVVAAVLLLRPGARMPRMPRNRPIPSFAPALSPASPGEPASQPEAVSL